MAQARYHYERAFEHYLRAQRMPYVAVNEARQTLLPRAFDESTLAGLPGSMKSFDFVVYGPQRNLLVDVKGRALAGRPVRPLIAPAALAAHRHRRTRPGAARARLECWATQRDLDDLLRWEALFGEGFEAALVFVYGSPEQPPDGLFEQVFDFEEQWYGLRAITVAQYARYSKQRSQSWGTVDLPAHIYQELSEPFSPHYLGAELPEAAYCSGLNAPTRV